MDRDLEMVGVDLHVVHQLVEQPSPLGLVGLLLHAVDVELRQQVGELLEALGEVVGAASLPAPTDRILRTCSPLRREHVGTTYQRRKCAVS